MRWLAITVGTLAVTAIAEIALVVVSLHYLGLLPTLLLLLAASGLGIWLLARVGPRSWREVREAMAEQRPPAAEAVDGVLGLAACLLIVVPGFLTAVVGLVVLLPPVRRALHHRALAQLAQRLPASMIGPMRVRARRGRAATTPGSMPPATPMDVRVIEGDIRR
ncbi:FxsA family protein [Fodinicola feengrottensis]|uniref:FxsA family protein n=1 Tax=Fodinicola feengrottensis TaxID=435914 RepID=A0ABP4TVT6_9ACTN|nr:FxsA family protein [Fodinicola feengrottensis]